MGERRANRLGFVECLRLLAALAVFAQHLSEHYPAVPALAAMRQAGPGLLGVLIFFLISGYVVPMSVKGAFAPGRFMVRRAFRIYPALLAAFALVVVLAQARVLPGWAWLAGAGARTWAANLLLVQDYTGQRAILGVTWTLSIEFVWYGLFALVFARWGVGAGCRLGVALPLVLLALAGASLVLGVRLPVGRITFVYACVLGFLAWLHDRGLLSRQALLGHAAAFVAVLGVVDLVGFGLFRHDTTSLGQVLWPTLAAPALFLAGVLAARVRTARLLSRGALPALGAASYSLYLLHPVGLALGASFGDAHGPAAGIALAVGITALLAAVGYHLVERPGIALGRWLTAPGKARPETLSVRPAT